MVEAVEGELGRQLHGGRGGPGRHDGGQVRDGGARRDGRAALLVHRLRAAGPPIVIAVLVEQAGRGGEVAAPIAGDLMARYLNGLR